MFKTLPVSARRPFALETSSSAFLPEGFVSRYLFASLMSSKMWPTARAVLKSSSIADSNFSLNALTIVSNSFSSFEVFSDTSSLLKNSEILVKVV